VHLACRLRASARYPVLNRADGYAEVLNGLKAYPTDFTGADNHVAALMERYGDLANATRAAIEASDEAGNADNADIFPAFSHSLDKALLGSP